MGVGVGRAEQGPPYYWGLGDKSTHFQQQLSLERSRKLALESKAEAREEEQEVGAGAATVGSPSFEERPSSGAR